MKSLEAAVLTAAYLALALFAVWVFAHLVTYYFNQ